MEAIHWKNLVLIKDALRSSAERIWASLLQNAIERNKGRVLVYLLTSCKKTLLKRYSFMLQCTQVEEIDSFTNIFSQITDSSENEGTIVFLDSIDIATLNSSFDRVVASLEAISQYVTVIARMHSECISSQKWERLNSISHVTYSLEPRNMAAPLCTLVSHKIDGRRVFKMGTVHIEDSFLLIFKQYKTQDVNAVVKEKNNVPVPQSSFDMGLHLKKSEFEARESVCLPYEAAQKEEELVRLRVKENRKIRAGGRIIYIPDEADDFDESDPDDDLEI